MPKTITIDVGKLSAVLAGKGLASGTAAYVCGLTNNDFGRIVARGWGFKNEVDLMVEGLVDESFVIDRLDEVLSSSFVKSTINANDDPEALAEEYFAEEIAQDSPRSRLLSWFKSQFGLTAATLAERRAEDVPVVEMTAEEDEPEVEEDFDEAPDAPEELSEPRLSVKKTKAAIEAAEDKPAAAKEFFLKELEMENSPEEGIKPRVTLIAWFKDEYGLEPAKEKEE